MAENNYLVRAVSSAEDRRARQMKLLADIARQVNLFAGGFQNLVN